MVTEVRSLYAPNGCKLQVAFCKLTQQAIALLTARTPTVALNGIPKSCPSDGIVF
ncbi:hypothetical protein [Microcoleus sp. B4-C1]|uniref:hypothetical protein n=1 Tax=Microcoleus sp. B4-C1 TaxID=2818660 RepID=UPI002FD4B7E8